MTQISTGGPYIAIEVHKAMLEVKDGIIMELFNRIEKLEGKVAELEARQNKRYLCAGGEVVEAPADEPRLKVDTVNGKLVPWSDELEQFFKPWIDLGVFDKIPLEPGEGYEFLPHLAVPEAGDEFWHIKDSRWTLSVEARPGFQHHSEPGQMVGPYRRKIKATPVFQTVPSGTIQVVLADPKTFLVDSEQAYPLPKCHKCNSEPVWTTHNGLHRISCSTCMTFGTSPTKSIKQAVEWWTKMCAPVAGESAPISPEVPQAHGLTNPATPSAAVGVSEPVAECSLCNGDGGRPDPTFVYWRRCVRCEGTGKEPSDSKPTNVHNQETEDTPPRGNDVPATDKPFQIEHGKRYLRRDGQVSGAITANCGYPYTKPFPFFDWDNQFAYRTDGTYSVTRMAHGLDLIAEYSEPSQPAESPDDWVMITDPKHVLRSCDEVRYAEGSWHPCRASVGAKRGTQTWEEFRCRRKDLPVVPGEQDDVLELTELPDSVKTALNEVVKRKLSESDTAPAESPDDWVTQDRVPLRFSDEFRWNWDNGTVSPWLGNCQWTYKHGDIYKGDTREIRRIEIRCRRKDLPVVPDKSHALPSPWRPMTEKPTCDWFWLVWKGGDMSVFHRLDDIPFYGAIAWQLIEKPQYPNAAPADKPRMRQVTLREYTRAGSTEHLWTTSDLMSESHYTGRTAVVEVPE